MLHGEEKIWFLVNTLDKERKVTPKGKPVALHPMNDLNNNYSKPDFIELFETLEQDDVAKLLNQLPTDQTYGKYLIELLPGFDGYVEKLEENPEYLEWLGKKPKPKNYFSLERRVGFAKPKEENKELPSQNMTRSVLNGVSSRSSTNASWHGSRKLMNNTTSRLPIC